MRQEQEKPLIAEDGWEHMPPGDCVMRRDHRSGRGLLGVGRRALAKATRNQEVERLRLFGEPWKEGIKLRESAQAARQRSFHRKLLRPNIST